MPSQHVVNVGKMIEDVESVLLALLEACSAAMLILSPRNTTQEQATKFAVRSVFRQDQGYRVRTAIDGRQRDQEPGGQLAKGTLGRLWSTTAGLGRVQGFVSTSIRCDFISFVSSYPTWFSIVTYHLPLAIVAITLLLLRRWPRCYREPAGPGDGGRCLNLRKQNEAKWVGDSGQGQRKGQGGCKTRGRARSLREQGTYDSERASETGSNIDAVN